MRHRVGQRKLNRTSAHRRAMQRNLAQSLFEHGQVRTTLAKAKDLRPFAEQLITLAKKTRSGSITARRQIHKLLSDRSMVPADHRDAYEGLGPAGRKKILRAPSGRRHRTGEPKGKLAFTGESVTHRLINTIAPRYADRDGGYARIIRLPDRRIGDHGELAVVQLVGDEQGPGSVTKSPKTARRKRADARYAMAAKALSRGRNPAAKSKKSPEDAAEPDVADESSASDADAESTPEQDGGDQA